MEQENVELPNFSIELLSGQFDNRVWELKSNFVFHVSGLG